jgi:REP element-mobilizing transposase RayT
MDRYRVVKGDGRSYLCTCACTLWLPLFNAGPHYFQIVLDSLRFCRQSKGLTLHAYVLMIDHLHLIVRHEDISALMRDFKSWTSRQIRQQIEQEKRTDLLRLLEMSAPHGGSPQEYKVWQDGFHPKGIESDTMLLQKIQYVHNNPVRKGFVAAPEDWRFSSARNYLAGDNSILEIDTVESLVI